MCIVRVTPDGRGTFRKRGDPEIGTSAIFAIEVPKTRTAGPGEFSTRETGPTNEHQPITRAEGTRFYGATFRNSGDPSDFASKSLSAKQIAESGPYRSVPDKSHQGGKPQGQIRDNFVTPKPQFAVATTVLPLLFAVCLAAILGGSGKEKSKHGKLLPRYRRKPKRRSLDRGLPDDAVLRQLAITYQLQQRKLWPELVDQGLLPTPSAELVDRMVLDFKQRHWTGKVELTTLLGFIRITLKLAGNYLRYSTHNSQATSCEDQMVNALQKAHSRKEFIPWSYVFADYAVSGLDASRRGYSMYKKVLQDAGKGEEKSSDLCGAAIVGTYIDDFTRASREEIEWWKLAHLSKRLGKRLIGVSDGFTLDDPEWDLKLSIYILLSRLFIKGSREKSARGLRGAMRRRTCTGRLAFGYTRQIVCDEDGNPVVKANGLHKHKPAIDPKSRKWVKKLFELFVVDQWSVRRITKYFNKERVDNWDGWTPRAIQQLLVNPSFIGVFIWNKYRRVWNDDTKKMEKVRNPRSEWEVYYEPKLALIQMETWRKSLRRAAYLRAASPNTGKKYSRNEIDPSTLVSGTLYCGYCGCELKLTRSAGKYRSLACLNGTNHAKDCKLTTSKSTKIIEDSLLSFLFDKILTKEVVEKLVVDANIYIKSLEPTQYSDASPKRKNIKILRSKIRRLLALVTRAKDDNDPVIRLYDVEMRKLNRQLERETAELTEIRIQNSPPPPPLDATRMCKYLQEARQLLNGGMPAAALALRELTGRITVTEEIVPGKKRPCWVATFSPQLVRFLDYCANTTNCPDRVTLDVLNTRNWITVHKVSVVLEKSYDYETYASRAAELTAKGVSIPAIAATLGLCIHTVEAAVYYARTGEAPKRCQTKSDRKRSTKPKRLTFKDVAAKVAKLKDVDRIPLYKIAKDNGWSRRMVGLAYTFAHPERAAEAITKGRRVRGPRELSDDQREKLKTLVEAGKMSVAEIAKEVPCSEATVWRIRREIRSA